MPMDPSKVGLEGEPTLRSWTPMQCNTYALGVGCGTDELQFTTEKNQQVLPTMAVILSGGAPIYEAGSWQRGALLHGDEAIELSGPIPPEGSARCTGRIAALYDKGKAALLVTETRAEDPDSGAVLFTKRTSYFIRGEGGFGGDRGPANEVEIPESRKPDLEISYDTLPQQALIYRLSGDVNPLHSDPELAQKAGFDRPILHGLCTYGFSGRALLHGLCGSDPARVRSMEGRFSKPVFPGESLTVSMWVDGGEALFRTTSSSGAVVIDQGRFRFDP